MPIRNGEKTDTQVDEASLATWKVIGGHQVYPNWSRRGAAGTVYAAINRVLRSPVALKVLEGPAIDRELLGVRLVHGVTAKAHHRHLVPILHAELEKTTGNPYYVMPLADDLHDGEIVSWIPEDYRPKTLDAFLRLEGKPLPLAEALYVTEQLLLAVRHLHGESLIHCDVKPSNIFFLGGGEARQGRWVLGDFGSTVLYRSSEAWLWGTPWYMPPERLVSPKVDVFALGKTLFRMVSRWGPPRNPEDTDLFELFRAGHLLLPLDDPESREGLRDLLLRACSRDARERFSATELWEAVRDLQQHAGMTREVELTLAWDYDRVKDVLPLTLGDLHADHLEGLSEEEARQLVGLLLKVRTLVTPLNTEIDRGSVVVRLELTRAEAEHLEEAIAAGHFAEFPLTRVRTYLPGTPPDGRATPFVRQPLVASWSEVVRKGAPADPEGLSSDQFATPKTWRARFRRACMNWRFWLATGILTAGLLLTLSLRSGLPLPIGDCPFLSRTPLELGKVADRTAEPGTEVRIPLAVKRHTHSGPIRLLLIPEGGGDIKADPVTLPAGSDRAHAVLRVGSKVRPGVYRIHIRPCLANEALQGLAFFLTVRAPFKTAPSSPEPETRGEGKDTRHAQPDPFPGPSHGPLAQGPGERKFVFGEAMGAAGPELHAP